MNPPYHSLLFQYPSPAAHQTMYGNAWYARYARSVTSIISFSVEIYTAIGLKFFSETHRDRISMDTRRRDWGHRTEYNRFDLPPALNIALCDVAKRHRLRGRWCYAADPGAR